MSGPCQCPVCGTEIQDDLVAVFPEFGLAIGNGQFVHLPRREMDILNFLYGRMGRFVTKGQLFDVVYQGDDEPEDVVVIESHISKLKKKLSGLGISIRSERFMGYMLERVQK